MRAVNTPGINAAALPGAKPVSAQRQAPSAQGAAKGFVTGSLPTQFGAKSALTGDKNLATRPTAHSYKAADFTVSMSADDGAKFAQNQEKSNFQSLQQNYQRPQ